MQGRNWLPLGDPGTSKEVADAMALFRDKHEKSLIEHSPVDRANREAYTLWARSISDWLYGTSHVRVSYSLNYDGVEIERLSPGTRESSYYFFTSQLIPMTIDR
jgi:hypothetical protein